MPTRSPTPSILLESLGRSGYADALAEQNDRIDRVLAWRAEAQAGARAPVGFLLLVEHDPVLTVGRKADARELGLSPEAWRERGVEVVETNRGGRITWHGPGQIVLYPILDLQRLGLGLHDYLRRLEQVAIELLATYGLEAHRDPEATGAWVGDRKVAAIGIHVRRWVSMHGMAINVVNPTDVFRDFEPCGITGRGVASITELVGGENVEIEDARRRLVDVFQRSMGLHIQHPL